MPAARPVKVNAPSAPAVVSRTTAADEIETFTCPAEDEAVPVERYYASTDC